MNAARTITLAAIVGRSRYNPRPHGESKAGRESKAASLERRGQFTPLIVRPAEHPEQYEIDDGGCRWDAMRLLVDRGAWTWQHPVDVLVVNGGDALAIERALAVNILRSPLHPVEEFEAFAALVAAGVAIETVAADFAVPVRHVRQRLKLDELSPRVRAGWRDGKLSAEAAQLLTGYADHAAQDAILDRYPLGMSVYTVAMIREELSRRGVTANDPQARYVGVDAYVAAGGALDEQLFEPLPMLLDLPLLRRLAREKMISAAEPLLERTGLGSIVIRDEIPAGEQLKWDRLQPRFTKIQSGELDRLAKRHMDEAPTEPGDDADAATIEVYDHAVEAHDARFEALREKIELEALRKSTTPEERAAAAIWVWVGYDGELLTDIGRTPPKPGAKTTAEARAPVERPFAATAAPKTLAQVFAGDAAPEPEKPPGKALVAVLDEAMSEGYAALVAERPYLAMLLATAALWAMNNQSAVRITGKPRPGAQKTGLGFVEAAAAALDSFDGIYGREHIMLRFAGAVAGTINVAPATSYEGYRHGKAEAIGLAELMAAYAGDAHDAAMAAALDYDAYFAAATRTATLAAAEAAGADMKHLRKLAKADLAQAAATLCRDRAWLPAELRPVDRPALQASALSKLPETLPTLADAMADALEKDGAFDEPPADGRTAVDAVQAFLMRHCTSGDDREMVKAQVLFDAFRDRMPAGDTALVPTMQAFGTLLGDYGIRKKRLAAGVHYVGLDLVAAPAAQAAE